MKRFWDKVDVKGPDDCWEWQASLFRAGYGQTQHPVTGQGMGAHRVAYILTKGEPAKGLAVAHICHNKRCCNPAHLEAQTYRQNARANFKRPNKSKAQKWTDEQIAEMHRLRAQGLVPRQIAEIVGAPLKTVERHVYKLNRTDRSAA